MLKIELEDFAMSVEKIRPNAEVAWTEGNDGRDAHYYIEYRCPKCNRRIGYYMSSTACDKCGTFYDWGNREPRIEITRHVEW
jgi:hypothetical protein